MRKLQLTPPLVILIMGYPGAGKTFFGRQLAEQYDIPRVSEDDIRFELFERPQFNKDEADIIKRIKNLTLDQLLLTGQTVIVEGTNLRNAERQDVIAHASAHGYQTLTVWLQTDLQTSAARAAKRDRRNPDSKHSFEVNQRTFDMYRSSLQRPTEKDDFVVISGKHAFQSQSLTVLKKITGMYSDKLISRSTLAPRVAPRANKLVQ